MEKYKRFIQKNLNWYDQNCRKKNIVDIYDNVLHRRSLVRDYYPLFEDYTFSETCETCGSKMVRVIGKRIKKFCSSKCRYESKEESPKKIHYNITILKTYSDVQEALNFSDIPMTRFDRAYVWEGKPFDPANIHTEMFRIRPDDKVFDITFIDGSSGQVATKRNEFSTDYIKTMIKKAVVVGTYEEIYFRNAKECFVECLFCKKLYMKYKYCGGQLKQIRKVRHNLCSYQCICSSRKELYPTSIETNLKQSTTMKRLIKEGKFTPCVTNSWTHRTSIAKINGKEIAVRSSFEKIFWEQYSGVLEYETVRVPYFNPVKNKVCNYIIDFYDKNRGLLIEIKPHSLKDDEVVIEKAKAATKYAEERNLKYVILTEKDFMLDNSEEIK